MGFGPRALEVLELSAAAVTREFWGGKRVLVTGHTGFKGAWLTLWLQRLGAHVTGLALAPPSHPALFELAGVERLCASACVDIRDARATRERIEEARPDIVFHLAAQSLVRPSYDEPLATFATNTMGTVHVLEALRATPCVRVAVVVTTDKVYRNLEQGSAFAEADPLGGHDPYSASKAASEVAIESYRAAFLAPKGVAVASARAGNVIGGGDWAQDRLVPDAVRAWAAGVALDVRRPDAVRPWQHVLEPLHGYLVLAQELWDNPQRAGAYNFGPGAGKARHVREVVTQLQRGWPGAQVHFATAEAGPHEARLLALDTRKIEGLGVRARWELDEAIARTVAWYRDQQAGRDARDLCLQDIEAYEAAG